MRNALMLIPVLLLWFACETLVDENDENTLKINQIQVVGSHNSYKLAMDAAIMAQFTMLDSNAARSLDYAHQSLTEQLDLGMRKLEIDIFHDPDGGRYSRPATLIQMEEAGMAVSYPDSQVMNQPGFKVLHVQDLDFRSNCLTLHACLEEINAWSAKHPHHVPIAISFNAKSSEIPSRPDFVVPLPFTSEVFDALDSTILAVIPKEKIITPDEVKGQYATLEEAVKAANWPTLASGRGRFLFVLDEGGEKREAYIEGHPSLDGRVMFVSMHPGRPEAAFIIFNNPIKNLDSIQHLVKMGFMVRTRADAGTKEARLGDYQRLEAAMASGAQFISTDYYMVDDRLGTAYRVSLPNGEIARCNPINGPRHCAVTTTAHR